MSLLSFTCFQLGFTGIYKESIILPWICGLYAAVCIWGLQATVYKDWEFRVCGRFGCMSGVMCGGLYTGFEGYVRDLSESLNLEPKKRR